MNKYMIMTKALDEWSVTKEVLWQNDRRRVIFLTDPETNIEGISSDDITVFSRYSDWASKFLSGDFR